MISLYLILSAFQWVWVLFLLWCQPSCSQNSWRLLQMICQHIKPFAVWMRSRGIESQGTVILLLGRDELCLEEQSKLRCLHSREDQERCRTHLECRKAEVQFVRLQRSDTQPLLLFDRQKDEWGRVDVILLLAVKRLRSLWYQQQLPHQMPTSLRNSPVLWCPCIDYHR